ncbi:MAG: MvdC/MvdD family ATP grasp protein, partial [Pseudonocardiaceae bacterium]
MGGEPTVLVLTQSCDVTADYVVEELSRRGTPVFRCDPGDFPRTLSLAAELGGGWTGSLRLPEREVRLQDVGCAWYRRPSAFEFPEGLNPEERRWAQAEARLGVGGVLATLPRWLNHPSDIARVQYKPLQLQSALAVGLTVPPTLLTNAADAARSFAQQH